MPVRLDHLTVVAADLEVSARFYDAVLAAAGWERVVAFQDFEDEDEVGEEAVGYGLDDVVTLWVVAGRRPTSAAHIARRVDAATTVDHVGAVLGSAPRPRDHDRPGYYGVSGRDPDGNVVEVFAGR